MELCEFETSLIYKVSSRTARAVTQRNPVSKNKQTNKGEFIIIKMGLKAFLPFVHLCPDSSLPVEIGKIIQPEEVRLPAWEENFFSQY